MVAGIGGFHFTVGLATALEEGVDNVMGAMTAKPADCFEHFLLAKHPGRRRHVVVPEARHGFSGFEWNRGLVGENMAADCAGQFLAHSFKPLILYFALDQRILTASRAENLDWPNGRSVRHFFHRSSVWGKCVVVVKNRDVP